MTIELIMAFVVAWLLNPLVCFFEGRVFKKGKPKARRALAILVTYLLVIAVSPLISVSSAWAMADILNIFMAAPNLLALFLLRKKIHR